MQNISIKTWLDSKIGPQNGKTSWNITNVALNNITY